MASAASLLAQVRGTPVGVMGLGVAGRAMARALAAHGAVLTLVDHNPALGPELTKAFAGARVVAGQVPADVFAGCAMVALSPGVPPSDGAIVAAAAGGKPVFGDVELLALLRPRPKTLAITGTNGKSTTTSLAGALAQSLGLEAFVGGNLGDPIGDWVAQGASAPAWGILELSSYQIDGLRQFQPDVAVVLNVTPDHLARYGTMAAYAASKGRLVEALPAHGTAVLNAEDPATRAMAERCAGRVLWLSTQPALPQKLPGGAPQGLVVQKGVAVPVGAVAEVLAPMPLGHDTLLGRHNQQNTLAALLALSAFVPFAPHEQARTTAALRAAYGAYRGLPHRLAYVAEVEGVRYLDDSKATNDASAATAVRAMGAPYVLLVGGPDKGGGYAELIAALRAVPPKAIVAFGAAQNILAEALAQSCPALFVAPDLAGACAQAKALSAPGDTVLLSPACTSFDAFKDYRHRGEVFAAWVRAQ